MQSIPPILLALAGVFIPISLFAQTPSNLGAVNDVVTIELGRPFTFNVLDNDDLPAGFFTGVGVEWSNKPECFELSDNGEFTITGGAACCGIIWFSYFYTDCPEDIVQNCSAFVQINLICPKPDCSFIDMEYVDSLFDIPRCANVCAHSAVRVFTSPRPGATFSWSISGGTFDSGASSPEIEVVWGAAGPGHIVLEINDNGTVRFLEKCINILAKPTASFTPTDSLVCKGSDIRFFNTSNGAQDFLWDFGDGNYSSMESPTHRYDAPGTYTVCLSATNDNTDGLGDPLCCCTDVVCMDVVVDSLTGPEIFCVSTLCAGDSALYYTNASGCSDYNWTVLNHEGQPVAFSGQGSDTIRLQWGQGPYGVVRLEVISCDQAYCDRPAEVVIPIIPASADIEGPVRLCWSEVARYSLPKWPGVNYQWTVTGGVIEAGQGTHAVLVKWGFGQTGAIEVNYSSPFLMGLPGHTPPDCSGQAVLNVTIRPEIKLISSSIGVICVGQPTEISAFSSGNNNWSISPPVPFTQQSPGSISVTWPAPGTYTVTATADNPDAFCNDSAQIAIQVLEIARPDSITGPLEICPGETHTYFGHSSVPGTIFFWSVTGGSPSFGRGRNITVTWDQFGPYRIELLQEVAYIGFCRSESTVLEVTSKAYELPLSIDGPAPCTNSIQSYAALPVQHPDVSFFWKIDPPEAGSVIAGQGTPDVSIQWGNSPGMAKLRPVLSLCGSVFTDSVMLQIDAVPAPVIVQTGVLCSGALVTLDAGSGYAAWEWSTGDATQTLNVDQPGTYLVTVTNADGCRAVGFHQVVQLAEPEASISTGDSPVLCINPPDPSASTVQLAALSGDGYTFQWYENGLPVGTGGPTFTHINTLMAGSYAYRVEVTGLNSCSSLSNTITISQISCDGSGDPGSPGDPGHPCIPDNYTLSISAQPQNPDCNVVDFSATASANVSLTRWDFGDGNTLSGAITSTQHIYTRPGCYRAVVEGKVPGTQNGMAQMCQVRKAEKVCVPVAADFEYAKQCTLGVYRLTFNDLSVHLPDEAISSWNWDFGDGNTSVMTNPVHDYVSPGAYTVTLRVTLENGCSALAIQTINLSDPPAPAITFTPDAPCAGEAVGFTENSADNIINWLWSFGDGAASGVRNPKHAYLNAGTFSVALTITDSQGCSASNEADITVHPLPPDDTISVSPRRRVCRGESITLSAPAGSGYTYLWNDNSSGPSLVVTESGTYSVTVFNAFGCAYTPPPVTVTVFPLPEVGISGNLTICDAGTQLFATPGYNSYQWLNPVTPIGHNFNTLLLGSSMLLHPAYAVSVTDHNGCSAVSAPVTVAVAAPPSFVLSATPDACEGTLSTLAVTPVLPDVQYFWNTGQAGPSITAWQTGAYTATGRNTLTGCSFSNVIIIDPQPDLCILPVGCYDICDPDTLCGPPGLAAYQWNLNGVPIPGANDSCLIVAESGIYTLTGVAANGCTRTSDALALQVIPCGCDALSVFIEPVPGDTCCLTLSYRNTIDADILGLMIRSSETDFSFDLGSLSSALGVYTIGPNWIGLVNSISGNPLPAGALNDFLGLCLKNISATPQQIIFDWYGFDFDVLCSDTTELHCPVEPPCLYISDEDIFCQDEATVYSFTVCNPVDAAFSIGYFELQPESPASVQVLPQAFSVSPPIARGECRSFSVTLTGQALAGENFCFRLPAHDFDPAVVDTALCCALDTIFCIAIPACVLCDNVVATVDAVAGEDCCFNVSLLNNFAGDYFDGVVVRLLSAGTEFTSFDNPFGSGWATLSFSPGALLLDVVPPLGVHLPLGNTGLPQFCIQTENEPLPQLEIHWLHADSVVCKDTLALPCDPPCGYLAGQDITCNADGTWNYQAVFHNSSPHTIHSLFAVFTTPAEMSGYNAGFTGLSIAPGDTFPLDLRAGTPAMPGEQVCFTLAMHDTLNVECCNIRYCFTAPDCPLRCIDTSLIDSSVFCPTIYDPVCGCDGNTYANACVAMFYNGVTSWTPGECRNDACACDDAFFAEVQRKFRIFRKPSPSVGYAYLLRPLGALTDCDQVTWSYRAISSDHSTPWVEMTTTTGAEAFTFTFPGGGVYLVCMSVRRSTPGGEVCESEFCTFISLPDQFHTDDHALMNVFPNPSAGQVFLAAAADIKGRAQLALTDVLGRTLMQWHVDDLWQNHVAPLDLSHLPSGLYLLRVVAGDGKKQTVRIIRE